MRYIHTVLLAVGLLVGNAITAPIPDNATLTPITERPPNDNDKRSPDSDGPTLTPVTSRPANDNDGRPPLKNN
ncbi:hypothetical protein LZ32DRAFT_127860 [Colletotrichum eremochloae]|nr:hypothetical protein LZ32DRAFT_127860 [Colletotrichum eremochloae]